MWTWYSRYCQPELSFDTIYEVSIGISAYRRSLHHSGCLLLAYVVLCSHVAVFRTYLLANAGAYLTENLLRLAHMDSTLG